MQDKPNPQNEPAVKGGAAQLAPSGKPNAQTGPSDAGQKSAQEAPLPRDEFSAPESSTGEKVSPQDKPGWQDKLKTGWQDGLKSAQERMKSAQERMESVDWRGKLAETKDKIKSVDWQGKLKAAEDKVKSVDWEEKLKTAEEKIKSLDTQDKPSFVRQAENRGGKLTDYWPLAALFLISFLAAAALRWQTGGGGLVLMHYFMGISLCIFAMLKFFHLFVFAEGFRMYDTFAQRWPVYAYAYPLFELVLGLAYLSFFLPVITYAATIAVLGIGGYGALTARRRGVDPNAPSMGTALEVPLTTLTWMEDAVLVIIAALMLLARLGMV